jgi:alpha-tubulin suppressor-like RCC1 family protein
MHFQSHTVALARTCGKLAAYLLVATLGCRESTSPAGDSRVKEIRTSFATTCAIVESSGKLYCWGYNKRGVIGIGTADSPQPLPVAVSGELMFNKVRVGLEHACGMTSSGPYCWGGFAGNVVAETRPVPNSMVPIKVAGGERFVDLESNGAFLEPASTCSDATCGGTTCGIDISRDLYCWEALSPTTTPPALTPELVSGAPKVASLSLGMRHICVIDPQQKLWCWGQNTYRQVGQPQVVASTPMQVAPELSFKAVSAGRAHTCAIELSGDAYCWGANPANQLAAPSSEICAIRFINVPCRSTPEKVQGGYKFVAISAGGGSPGTTQVQQNSHTCGITTTDTLVCWGWNADGQLGDGTTLDRATPTPVFGNMKFKAVATGWRHTCGISMDGKAYCWGANDWGQLGIGTTIGSSVPIPVGGDLSFSSLLPRRHLGAGLFAIT